MASCDSKMVMKSHFNIFIKVTRVWHNIFLACGANKNVENIEVEQTLQTSTKANKQAP